MHFGAGLAGTTSPYAARVISGVKVTRACARHVNINAGSLEQKKVTRTLQGEESILSPPPPTLLTSRVKDQRLDSCEKAFGNSGTLFLHPSV